MTIRESHSSPAGTHPSYASARIVVVCDECGDTFSATSCEDDIWRLNGKNVGSREQSDYCRACAQQIMDALGASQSQEEKR